MQNIWLNLAVYGVIVIVCLLLYLSFKEFVGKKYPLCLHRRKEWKQFGQRQEHPYHTVYTTGLECVVCGKRFQETIKTEHIYSRSPDALILVGEVEDELGLGGITCLYTEHRWSFFALVSAIYDNDKKAARRFVKAYLIQQAVDLANRND